MNKSYIEWIDYYENATKEDVIQDMMLDINSIKEKNKEIERLNNKVEELMELYTTERHCKDDYKYIINELEKWLEEQHQFIIEIPAFTKEISIEHKTMELCYENILDKLQELKGSDKE